MLVACLGFAINQRMAGRKRLSPARSAWLASLAAMLLAHGACAGAQGAISTRELADLSLEELANIEGHLGRRGAPSALADAAGRRSTSSPPRTSAARARRRLPEALRLAPNLQVARVDAQHLRDQRARLQQRDRQQAAGADRRPHRLHAALLRRVLGPAGRDARGRRAHRGDQRARARRCGAPTPSTA